MQQTKKTKVIPEPDSKFGQIIDEFIAVSEWEGNGAETLHSWLDDFYRLYLVSHADESSAKITVAAHFGFYSTLSKFIRLIQDLSTSKNTKP